MENFLDKQRFLPTINKQSLKLWIVREDMQSVCKIQEEDISG